MSDDAWMTLASSFLHEGFRVMVRGRLRGVWLRGELPPGPVVWAANHHSWWDPFVADVLVRGHGRRTAVVMAEDSLAAYGFLRRLGVLGTGEVRAAVTAVGAGDVLVVFPEAELLPAAAPGPLAPGAAWYAQRTGATLVCAAVRVLARGHEAPEAYVDLRSVEVGGGTAPTTARLAATLRDALAEIDATTATSDPREPLPGFQPVVRGRRSWDERIARAASVGRRR